MSEDIRTSESAVPIVRKMTYEAPKITVLGSAIDLTAGPITTTDESPSGMRG